MQALLLFVLFQAAWFANVLGGARGTSWPGLAATSILIAFTCWRWIPSSTLFRVVYGVIVGLILDGALLWLEFTAYPQQEGAFLPPWMIALWAGFAAALPRMAPWLAGHRITAIGLGLLGGPAAYWTAEQFGAIEIAGAGGLAAVAVAWGLAMAVLPISAPLRLQRDATGEPLNT